MTDDELKVDVRAGALWLRLNRPAAFNALTEEVICGLDRAMDRACGDPAIRAVVITGEGRAFCAGADLKGVVSGTGSPAEQQRSLVSFLEHVGRVFDRLERMPLPTIAAVNGIALAGGVELMLCCDFVVASASATIGEGHAKFAQLPAGGGSVRLPRRIGAARAKYLMFTGEIVDAERAVDWGLFDLVASPDALETTADSIVQRIAAQSPLVLQRMKSLVADSGDRSADAALRAEIAMAGRHSLSFDRNEGLAAFVGKRKPVYRGE